MNRTLDRIDAYSAIAVQPMQTAPKDREILVYARWCWEGDDTGEPYGWRVAVWLTSETNSQRDKAFFAITSNPYDDKAFDAKAWAELPPETAF